MQTHRDSVAPCLEDSLALRRQIDQLQEHIDLLMVESSVIQERRRLLQQQATTPTAVTEKMQQLDNLCDESVHADLLDMGESSSCEESVSGLSFALEGAKGFSVSRSLSGSTAAILSDHSVVVQIKPHKPQVIVLKPQSRAISSDRSVTVQTKPLAPSRGSASKLRAKLRDIIAEHRRIQSMTTPHEPPALFQGLVECL